MATSTSPATARGLDPAAPRAPPHPRGAAADPLHAQGRDLRLPGWAVGGGHSLHVVCDLTLASRRARDLQADRRRRGELRRGLRLGLPGAEVGQKKAREIFFLGRDYSAEEAFQMGMVNAAVPHADLETVALDWAEEINSKSPTAIGC
jgi:naphthoate synthase